MNKRQMKKYKKKNCEKSWYNARKAEILMRKRMVVMMESIINGEELSPLSFAIEIVDSKRGSLKHPLGYIIHRNIHELPKLPFKYKGCISKD